MSLKFTVVTPSLNQGCFIEQTCLSVRAQARRVAIEHIVVDGGSTDETLAILDRYRTGLTVLCGPDSGQSEAIAKGIRVSSGDVVGWLNSDDVLLPGALDAVADFFHANPRASVVSGGGYYIDAAGQPIRIDRAGFTLGLAATFGRLTCYGSDGLFQPATFWRKDVYFQAGGLDETLHYAMDFDLFIRLARIQRFSGLPRLLAAARLHANSKTIRDRSACRRESHEVSGRYATSRAAWRRAGYRIADLARKLRLYSMRRLGLVNLRPAVYAAEP